MRLPQESTDKNIISPKLSFRKSFLKGKNIEDISQIKTLDFFPKFAFLKNMVFRANFGKSPIFLLNRCIIFFLIDDQPRKY